MKKLLLFLSFLAIAGVSHSQQMQMRSNLYDINNVLLDGSLTQWGVHDSANIFNDSITGGDARKMLNFSENFGLMRDGEFLVIERRTLFGSNSDTSFIWMEDMHQTMYTIQTILSGVSADSALLQDLYLGTQTVLKLNDTTYYDFTNTGAAASYGPGRFRVVFKSKSVPVIPPRQYTNILFTNIYPNPARVGSNVTLQFAPGLAPKTVFIYDMLGKEVLRQPITSSVSAQVRMPSVPTGNYVITIQFEKGIFSKIMTLQ